MATQKFSTCMNSINTHLDPQRSISFNLPDPYIYQVDLPRVAYTANQLASTGSESQPSARLPRPPWSAASTSTTGRVWPLKYPMEEVLPSGRRLWVPCS